MLRMSSLIVEHNYPIRVGAFLAVVNAPCIGSFGELLVVDHDEDWLKSSLDTTPNDVFFEQDLAASHFPDFKRDVASRFDNSLEVFENIRHRRFPVLDGLQLRDLDG